jgi:hypothetical protein
MISENITGKLIQMTIDYIDRFKINKDMEPVSHWPKGTSSRLV